MNNKFFKSALILTIGGFLTKGISLFIKIIVTRLLGIEGISLISLINPTYSLLITIASFNIMLSTSMRISLNNKASKVMVNSCYIMLVLNTVLILFMLLSGKAISKYLLHSEMAYYPLMAAMLSLPFISLGYIIKGYFYGKQNIAPHMISNVLEQLFRLLVIILVLPKVLKYGTVVAVSTFLLFNVLTESFSILVLYLFLPKNKRIDKKDLVFDINETKEILNITIPSVSGRMLGNIGYFFEPILLTYVLLHNGLSNSYIIREYGIYNAYVISTLLFPSFIINAISNSLLPEITKYYEMGNMKIVKKRIKEAIGISLVVGIITTVGILLFADKILLLLYDTSEGINYIRFLAPFFILFYIEAPLSTILTGINKIKTSTLISTSGILIKLIVMCSLGLMGFNIYALIIAEIVNIIYVSLFSTMVLCKTIIS